ncbi:MAG: hypothetical protein GF398_03395 [Chitinivibrionales bacterium]|nr:hypothetical protein [Chitinivibrionales bacterium]
MKKVLILMVCAMLGKAAGWQLVDKNNHLTDTPTVNDFMPLNVTSVRNSFHQILYPPNDPQCSFR